MVNLVDHSHDAGAAPRFSRAELLAVLEDVKDPEVPVLSVVELGIVRDVFADERDVTVLVTPTYSGCPAMREIEQDVATALRTHGATKVTVETVLAPAWTTDWIGAEAREKLRAYGIAPPGPRRTDDLVVLERRRARALCPRCGSIDTRTVSEFGSTACKALHVCNACGEPFDEFKAF